MGNLSRPDTRCHKRPRDTKKEYAAVPEYLAPGVFVEETSFRAKSIEGVGTSTTGFVGPTLRGPVGETPELLTSFGDFERIYGGLDDLAFGTNYLAQSASRPIIFEDIRQGLHGEYCKLGRQLPAELLPNR